MVGKTTSRDFSDKRQAIERLKASLDALVQEREKRIKALERVISDAEQRARYLGQFRIEDAGLYNMGAARSAVLRSWGIETAAEIDEAKIADVPGFGRNLTDRLVNWRDGLESKFRFEPAAVADPLEVRKVDREIAVQRMGLMKELRIRVVGLENQARRIRDDRSTLWKRLETAFNARMLAHQVIKPSVETDGAGKRKERPTYCASWKVGLAHPTLSTCLSPPPSRRTCGAVSQGCSNPTLELESLLTEKHAR